MQSITQPAFALSNPYKMIDPVAYPRRAVMSDNGCWQGHLEYVVCKPSQMEDSESFSPPSANLSSSAFILIAAATSVKTTVALPPLYNQTSSTTSSPTVLLNRWIKLRSFITKKKPFLTSVRRRLALILGSFIAMITESIGSGTSPRADSTTNLKRPGRDSLLSSISTL